MLRECKVLYALFAIVSIELTNVPYELISDIIDDEMEYIIK